MEGWRNKELVCLRFDAEHPSAPEIAYRGLDLTKESTNFFKTMGYNYFYAPFKDDK